MVGTAECQRGTCSCVNLIEGSGEVCGVSWPQEGSPGSEWNWAELGCVLQEALAVQRLS